MLAGCATEPPVRLVDPAGALLARVDPALKQELAGPVAKPQRIMSRGEVRQLWNADVSRLLSCIATHQALVQQLEVTEGGIPTKRPNEGKRK